MCTAGQRVLLTITGPRPSFMYIYSFASFCKIPFFGSYIREVLMLDDHIQGSTVVKVSFYYLGTISVVQGYSRLWVIEPLIVNGDGFLH